MKRIILATLLVAPLVAHAADKDGNFRLKGIGAKSCQTYVAEKSKNSPTYYLYRSWMNGYLTSYNLSSPGTYDAVGDLTVHALAAWLGSYCRANPQSSFVGATSALIAVVKPAELQEKPQLVEAKAQDRTIQIARETMRRVQQALKKRGYYAGAADGVFGPGTRKAIEAFQRAEGLTVTGLPTQATLLKLLVSR